jgi:hypothetical protein
VAVEPTGLQLLLVHFPLPHLGPKQYQASLSGTASKGGAQLITKGNTIRKRIMVAVSFFTPLEQAENVPVCMTHRGATITDEGKVLI